MTHLAVDHAPDMGEAALKALATYDLRHRLAIMAQGGFSDENWRSFAADGWLGMLAPADAGGSGLNDGEAGSVLRSFGRRLVCEPLLPVAVTTVSFLNACAETPVRMASLAAICKGDMRAVMIPDAQRDSGSLIAGAASATHFVIGAKGQTPRLLPVTAPGVSVVAAPAIDGSPLARVHIGESAMQEGERLLPGPQAWEQSLVATRIAAGFWTLGVIDSALAMTTSYVSQREQFGQALVDFQTVRHRLADMFIGANLARAALARSLAVEAPWRHQAALAAYLTVMKAGHRITRDAIQLHGGMGMTDELEISHFYRAILSLAAAYGSVRDHCGELALPRSAARLVAG